MSGTYSESFFYAHEPSSLASARRVAPIVVDLLRPVSVIDIGCGRGAWLAAFEECGITDLAGVDGAWVDTHDLLIDPRRFTPIDLASPFRLERRFDLAVSLEVAEHLSIASAETFVDSLVRLAPAILFGAAIPGQGGLKHLNEQWPGYWVRLFHEHDYVAIDAIRPLIWDIDDVAWWYAQNTLLFVNSAELADKVRRRASAVAAPVMALVHPRLYTGFRQASADETLRQLVRRIPWALRRSIAWHLLRRR